MGIHVTGLMVATWLQIMYFHRNHGKRGASMYVRSRSLYCQSYTRGFPLATYAVALVD